MPWDCCSMNLLLWGLLGVLGGGGQTLATAHYDVRSEGAPAAPWGDLLEALHPRLEAYFGRAPHQRLRVRILPDAEAYRRALIDDGQPPAGGGGYYAPATRTVYLFPQPSEYYTRQLLLHEAVHQFHYLVATGNRSPPAEWYTEGLAEYFAMHDYDGRTLVCGVVPAISLEDYPARARDDFRAAGGDLEAILAGRKPVSRPLDWALVHFLLDRHPVEFRQLAGRLDRGEDSLAAFHRSFGPATAELAGELARWIAAHQQPWEVVWTAWQQVGDALEGNSKTVGLALLKETPPVLRVELEPRQRVWKAGLVFGFRSPSDFRLLQIRDDGLVRVVRRTGRGWSDVARRKVELGGGRVAVSATRRGQEWLLAVAGTTVHTSRSGGRIGLHVDGCRVRFQVRGDREGEAPAEP